MKIARQLVRRGRFSSPWFRKEVEYICNDSAKMNFNWFYWHATTGDSTYLFNRRIIPDQINRLTFKPLRSQL